MIAFGFTTLYSHFTWPSSPRSAISDSARAKTRYDCVLPENGCPTIISPCRTTIISYSWIVFRKKYGSGCRFISTHASRMAISISA